MCLVRNQIPNQDGETFRVTLKTSILLHTISLHAHAQRPTYKMSSISAQPSACLCPDASSASDARASRKIATRRTAA